jgi:hypothetical protein
MVFIHNGEKLFQEAFCFYNKSQKQTEKEEKEKTGNIKHLEKIWGNYARFTGRLDDILEIMFPTAHDIQKETAKLIYQSHLSTEKQELLPLFCYHLNRSIKILDQNKEQWASAWADLMYDLGEFKLDEIPLDKINKNTPYVDIDDIIPHIYKSGNNWHVLWGSISEAGDIIRDIWDRIAGEEVQIIGVDDDKNFADLFLGTKKRPALLTMEIEEKGNLYKDDIDNNLIWIKPKTPYPAAEVKQQIDHIINESKKELLVFVIDLIFKRSRESNVIKGDELIRHLRNNDKKKKILIVGITGGTSPFIINSAEKAGADIVVFKKRGGDPENIAGTGHSGGGNPVGVFDLLWAVSWNVSVWRLLEEYKKNYINNKNNEFENIAVKFFSNIENASPFWKKYLDKWKTDINKEKIKRLFR